MRVALTDLLPEVVDRERVLCGFNVFGYEDALAVVAAAEEKSAPVLLMVNRAMADFMPPESCGPLFAGLADRSPARIAIHLDHARDLGVLRRALDSGFTSVMFDGSTKALAENIRLTKEARKLADGYGASLEGEVGTVPYSDLGETVVTMTDPSEAAAFAGETGVDVLAVSVGNIHRLTTPTARIDFERLRKIEAVTPLPLVIHGVSGLPESEIRRLLPTQVAKFNIGTRLRWVLGKRLREELQNDPEQFDRLQLMKSVIPEVKTAAVHSLSLSGW